MATSKTGVRFGEEKGVQRNKADEPKQNRPNRSPGQSNANRVLPSLKEDLVKSQSEDIKRVGKGLSPTGKGAARLSQQEAAGRAITRTASRAAGAVGALAQGYEIGRAIDEETGIGKKLVDKSGMGKAVEDVVKTERAGGVKLSAESKQRIKDEADSEMKRESSRGVKAEEAASEMKRESSRGKSSPEAKKEAPQKRQQAKEPEPSVREGRNENIDEDTRKKAMASVNLAKGGAIMNKGIGASMKPHNVFGSKKK